MSDRDERADEAMVQLTRYRKALEEIRDGWDADDEGSCRYCPIQPEGHEPNCPSMIATRALTREEPHLRAKEPDLLDEIARKAAWMLDNGATNENRDLCESVVSYARLRARQEEPVGYITEIDWGDGRGWIRQLYRRGSLIIHRTEEDAWSSMEYVGGIARTNGRVLPLFVGPAIDAR